MRVVQIFKWLVPSPIIILFKKNLPTNSQIGGIRRRGINWQMWHRWMFRLSRDQINYEKKGLGLALIETLRFLQTAKIFFRIYSLTLEFPFLAVFITRRKHLYFYYWVGIIILNEIFIFFEHSHKIVSRISQSDMAGPL